MGVAVALDSVLLSYSFLHLLRVHLRVNLSLAHLSHSAVIIKDLLRNRFVLKPLSNPSFFL